MTISDDAAIALLNGPETVRDDLLVRVEFIEPSSDDSAVVTMEFISGVPDGRNTNSMLSLSASCLTSAL